MTTTAQRSRAGWLADELRTDTGWIYHLDDDDRADLIDAVRRAHVDGQPLLAYRRHDFGFGPSLATLRGAFDEALHGRGSPSSRASRASR